MRSILMFQNDQLSEWKPTGVPPTDALTLTRIQDVLLAAYSGKGDRRLGVSWVATNHTSSVDFLEVGGFQSGTLPYAERELIEKFREKLVRRAKKVWGAPPKGQKWQTVQTMRAGNHPNTVGTILANAGRYLCVVGRPFTAVVWREMEGPETVMTSEPTVVLEDCYTPNNYILGQTYACSSEVFFDILRVRGYRVGICPQPKTK
jgi:hypothetical protein